jgi:serine protease Do
MKRFAPLLIVGFCAALGGSAAVSLPALMVGAATAQQGTTLGAPSAGDPLTLLSDRFEQISRQVLPAVASIEAIKMPRTPAGSAAKARPTEESGSGVITQFAGYKGFVVITNNHVVAQALPEKITVHLASGKIFKASKVWTDPESDVALLGVEAAGGLPTATLGDSDRVHVGQWVLAYGSPFGLSQTVTHGIISARERGQVSLGSTIRIKDFLQTDAAINPGSSGGPLVDLRGEVIGINTAIASHSGSNSGVAFSIPINLVKRVAKDLLEKGSVARGYLGLQVAPSFEAADAFKLGLDRVQGAWIERVYDGTPAAAAGVKINDVILQMDGVPIRNENHLINLVSGTPVGQRIRLQVWRDRGVLVLEAVVGDWQQALSRFGP